jgi:outer membrane protein TolC
LSQAIAVGYARTPALTSARADVGIAAAGVRLQRAGALPNFSGSVNATHNFSQAGSSATGGSTGGAGNSRVSFGGVQSNGVSLDLKQLIFDGGRISAEVRAAQRSETSFADVYRREFQTVAFNIATSYYNYLETQRTTAVDVEVVRQDEVQVDLIGAQVRAGTAARADIATAQLPLAQAQLAVIKAQGAELAAQATFANAMGLDADANVQPIDDTGFSPSAQISSLAVPTYNKAFARALALRPDYDSSAQGVAGAEDSLRAAKLGLFPQLAGTASTGTSSTGVGGGDYRNSSQIGLALSIPIYDQGVTAANKAQAQAQLDKANAELVTTKLGIQLSVKQALTNLVSARAALDQTRIELLQAQVVLQSTQAQYKAGVTTLPLLLNASVGVAQALTDRVNAIYSLRGAEQSLLYATGEIGQL